MNIAIKEDGVVDMLGTLSLRCKDRRRWILLDCLLVKREWKLKNHVSKQYVFGYNVLI